MGPAILLLWTAWVAAPGLDTPPTDGPLSDEELALLAALTSTTPEPEPAPTPTAGAFRGTVVEATLARNLAHAFDGLPTLFRSYRGSDRLTLIRDGVRLPITHGPFRLQDGWLMLAPHAVRGIEWDAQDGAHGPDLGAVIAVPGPSVADDGCGSAVHGVARSADRGVGLIANLGCGGPKYGAVVAGRFETLPTNRLQSDDADAVEGDRLGEQWSVHGRAEVKNAGLTFGADWTRRSTSVIRGPRAQTQPTIDHGLAFARYHGRNATVLAAYLRDSVDDVRSTDRYQVRADTSWSLTDRWQLGGGAWGQGTDQQFSLLDGRAFQVEPWLALGYESERLQVRLTGRFLWGRVTAAEAAVDAAEPLFRLHAAGAFTAGLGMARLGSAQRPCTTTLELTGSPARPRSGDQLDRRGRSDLPRRVGLRSPHGLRSASRNVLAAGRARHRRGVGLRRARRRTATPAAPGLRDGKSTSPPRGPKDVLSTRANSTPPAETFGAP